MLEALEGGDRTHGDQKPVEDEGHAHQGAPRTDGEGADRLADRRIPRLKQPRRGPDKNEEEGRGDGCKAENASQGRAAVLLGAGHPLPERSKGGMLGCVFGHAIVRHTMVNHASGPSCVYAPPPMLEAPDPPRPRSPLWLA